ncbi:MAG: precorrin-3B C(17)-methyltransferase, partial [Candidatus Scalindua sp.]|nr:precorrin-3B C(17)-methyltransferase [Candidatus Scalindua sp.]
MSGNNSSSSAGKLFVVGIGPGNPEHLSTRAIEALKESDCIVGYKTYINLIT